MPPVRIKERGKAKKGTMTRLLKQLFKLYPVRLATVLVCIIFNVFTNLCSSIFANFITVCLTAALQVNGNPFVGSYATTAMGITVSTNLTVLLVTMAVIYIVGILAAWFKGWPYDSYYLLKLEQSKLKEMIAYSERNMRYVGQEYDIRDMKICVSLIDIITETRDLFTFDGNLEFSEPDEFGNCTINTDKLKYRCFVNVNERNAYRFSNENRKYHYKHDLYIMKARQLYYQIRIEKEERWGV